MTRIEHIIKNRIHSGHYHPGDRIESERKLAQAFRLRHCQVRAGLQSLVDQGLLECRRGSGYYVLGAQAGSSTSLGLVLLEQAGSLWNESTIGALMQAAGKHDLTVRTFLRENSPDNLDHRLVDVMQSEVQAVLIQPSHVVNWGPAFAQALDSHFPLIFLERGLFPGVFSSVETNHFETGFLAAKLLSQAGCRQAAFLGYNTASNQVAEQRWQGFVAGCGFCGSPAPFPCFFDDLDRTVTKQLNEALASGADGLFAASGMFTRAACTWCLETGRQPGTDFALLGMDNMAPLPGLPYVVDCVIQDTEREAEVAIDLATHLIQNRGSSLNQTLLIPPRYGQGTTLRT